VLLPRGAGKLSQVRTFEERYGIKGAAIAEVGLIYGVASIGGLDIIRVTGSTGGLDTDAMEMIKAAIRATEDHEFVMMNIKGCDIAGHDGDAEAKVKMVEKIDRAVGYLLSHSTDDMYVVLTADHSTPVSIMNHSGDPVPVCMLGRGVRVDDVKEYGERSCSKGGLGRIRGSDLMDILLDLMDRAEKFGA